MTRVKERSIKWEYHKSPLPFATLVAPGRIWEGLFFFDTSAMKNQDEKRGTPDTVSCRAKRQLRHELNGQI